MNLWAARLSTFACWIKAFRSLSNLSAPAPGRPEAAARRLDKTPVGAVGLLEVFKVGSGPSDQEPSLVKGARWDYSGSDLDQF